MSFYQEARKTLHSSSAGKGLTQELVLRVLGLKSLAPVTGQSSLAPGRGLTQELVLRVLGLKSLAPSHR